MAQPRERRGTCLPLAKANVIDRVRADEKTTITVLVHGPNEFLDRTSRIQYVDPLLLEPIASQGRRQNMRTFWIYSNCTRTGFIVMGDGRSQSTMIVKDEMYSRTERSRHTK